MKRQELPGIWVEHELGGRTGVLHFISFHFFLAFAGIKLINGS